MEFFPRASFRLHRGILSTISFFLLLQPTCLLAIQSEMEFEGGQSMRPCFGRVAGRVVDPEGNPLSGATVVFHSRAYLYDTTIFPFPGWVMRNAGFEFKLKWEQSTTDDQGRFKFPNTKLIQNDSAVSVAHPDCASVSTFDIDDQMTIQMPEAMSVRGRIIDDGNPVQDVDVTIRGQFPFAELTGFVDHSNVKTDVDGRFEIPFVKKAQSTRLRVFKAGFADRKLDWFSESSQLPAAAFGIHFVGAPEYVHGDFVYKLRRATTVRIKAFDPRTKEIVNLEEAINVRGTFWGIRGFQFTDTNSTYSVSDSGSIEFANIEFGSNRFWIKPPESSGWLGATFDLDIKYGDTKTVEKEIELTQGSVVRGSVIDEQSRMPVNDVAIAYYPKKLEDHEQGVFPPAFVRTNEAGEFLITVPACPGELKMVGEAPGYITLCTNHSADLPDAIRNRYVREINPKPGTDLPPIEFRLTKANRVTGTVYYKEDVPAAGIMFAATHLRANNESSSRVIGRTDANGKFTIDSLFDDATLPYDLEPLQGRREPKTNRIFFWDLKQNLSCDLEVTRHSIEKTGMRLEVFLAPSITFARGRIVDQISGEGVAGLRLRAETLRPRLSITWQATTDANGYYDLSVLVPNASYKISSQSADYWGSLHDIEIGGQNGVQELTALEVHSRVEPKTKPFDPMVDLTKLKDDDALDALIKYVEDQLKNLPNRPPGGGWGAGNAHDNFKTKLMAKITEPARQLVRRQQAPDFECRVYLELLKQFSDPEFNEPFPHADLVNEARMALIRNIDGDGVFESYLNIYWGSTSTFYEQSIMQYSQKKEIDAWACRGLMQEYGTSLARSCNPKTVSDKSFEKKLDRVAQYWSQAAGSLADVEVHGQTLKEFMLKQFSRIEYDMKNLEGIDPGRIERILKMFEEIKRGPA